MAIERFGVKTYGAGKVRHAPLVRAGKWIFATGLRATTGRRDPASAVRRALEIATHDLAVATCLPLGGIWHAHKLCVLHCFAEIR